MTLSNTLKAEHDAKLQKKKRLLEELSLVQDVARANHAFDRVYNSIDHEFAEEKQSQELVMNTTITSHTGSMNSQNESSVDEGFWVPFDVRSKSSSNNNKEKRSSTLYLAAHHFEDIGGKGTTGN